MISLKLTIVFASLLLARLADVEFHVNWRGWYWIFGVFTGIVVML